MSDDGPTLKMVDYVVTAVILAVPLAIGIVFAVKNAKKNTRLEYLLGGQQMTTLPVAMSLFVTFQSAISLIGLPTDIYMFGIAIFLFYIGTTLSSIILYFMFVPLMYPLDVTSIFEYLHLRFRSKAVRMLSMFIGSSMNVLYLSITLFAPALALQIAAGIPLWMSVLTVGGIGTIYTVIGGIRSVIWTDVFQTVIVFAGIVATIVKGVLAVGSVERTWTLAEEGGRTKMMDFSPDPRHRMTVWGAILGSLFTSMSTAYNQATVQRIRSLKTLKAAKRTYIAIMPLQLAYGFFITLVGIVTYAYFAHTGCDPLKSGRIGNLNQISPYFVLHIMDDLPGMSGLYMATLFCGSLSTLSSGVNALAANTVEDVLGRPLRNVSERTATIITKIAAAFHGILICCLGYGAQYLKGPVIQIALSIVGAFGTPVMGMFIIGSVVPWSNKYGALAGGITSLAFNLWIGVGFLLYGRRPPILPAVPNEQCLSANSSVSRAAIDATVGYSFRNSTLSVLDTALGNHTSSPSSDTYGFFFYDVSYEWYPVYGIIICLVVGLFVSYCTRDESWRELYYMFNHQLVFPFVKRVWPLEDDKRFDELTSFQ